jgi:PEP-CTERM motif
VNVWCVDLLDNLATSGTYTVLPSSALSGAPGVPILTSEQVGEIGGLKLWGDEYLAQISKDPNVAAAVQLAIWTVEYGSVTYDPLGPPVDGAGGYVSQLLAAVGDGVIPSFYNFRVLIEAGNQTVITDAPEPSTWAMMLLGFAGLGYAGFRNARAKAALA